ncbi:IS1 family transposase, partial [Shigella dysenteriae]
LTGKIFTQRIERNNLTLRTRIKRLARKTICFSR